LQMGRFAELANPHQRLNSWTFSFLVVVCLITVVLMAEGWNTGYSNIHWCHCIIF
jgi:hypothetical protein